MPVKWMCLHKQESDTSMYNMLLDCKSSIKMYNLLVYWLTQQFSDQTLTGEFFYLLFGLTLRKISVVFDPVVMQRLQSHCVLAVLRFLL